MKKSNLFALMILATFAFGCSDDDVENTPTPAPNPSQLLILNEGSFGNGNGSMSMYDIKADTLYSEVYRNKNGVGLGDVAQTMMKRNGIGYVVVNGSNKIEAFNLSDFSTAGTISGLTSPRGMADVGNGLAYVTDLFSNSIHIVNLNTMLKTGSIPTNGYTEAIVTSGGFAYVGIRTLSTIGNQVYKIDLTLNSITDSITVSNDPANLVIDRDNNLWVLCTGGDGIFTNIDTARLVKIDLNNFAVSRTLDLGAASYETDMTINGDRDMLYYMNDGVYKMPIAATAAPLSTVVSEQAGQVFYGLGYDESRDLIFIGDAVDYSSPGKLLIHDAAGAKVKELTVGLLPNGFMFR